MTPESSPSLTGAKASPDPRKGRDPGNVSHPSHTLVCMDERGSEPDDLYSPDGLPKDGPALNRITREELLRYEHEAREAGVEERRIPFLVSIEAIGDLVGRRWLLGGGDRGFRDRYLTGSTEDDAGNRLMTYRIESLSHDLLTVQDCRGFDEMRRVLPTRTLLGAASEIYVAAFLTRRGYTVEFVETTGTVGGDFDIRVLVDKRWVAVEIKTKDDETTPTRTSMSRSLGQARTQLPKEGPGVIVLHLPPNWVAAADLAAVADDVALGVLRNSQRINAIVLMWERFYEPSSPGGPLVVGRVFRSTFHDRPRTPVVGLGELFAGPPAPSSIAFSGSR